MSGGYFNYNQYKIEETIEQIEQLLTNIDTFDEQNCDFWAKRLISESKPEVKKEINNGLKILRQALVYTKRIDYFLSGDDGEDSFLERLNEELAEANAVELL